MKEPEENMKLVHNRAWRMVDTGTDEAKITFEMGDDPTDEEVEQMLTKLKNGRE